MARHARPWFNAERRCWMVYLGGRKHTLCTAAKKTKRPPQAALDRLDDLKVEARRNPVPESPEQTVASVIERYIEVVFPLLAPGTVALRRPYLQSFAELHGWRLAGRNLGRREVPRRIRCLSTSNGRPNRHSHSLFRNCLPPNRRLLDSHGATPRS